MLRKLRNLIKINMKSIDFFEKVNENTHSSLYVPRKDQLNKAYLFTLLKGSYHGNKCVEGTLIVIVKKISPKYKTDWKIKDDYLFKIISRSSDLYNIMFMPDDWCYGETNWEVEEIKSNEI